MLYLYLRDCIELKLPKSVDVTCDLGPSGWSKAILSLYQMLYSLSNTRLCSCYSYTSHYTHCSVGCEVTGLLSCVARGHRSPSSLDICDLRYLVVSQACHLGFLIMPLAPLRGKVACVCQLYTLHTSCVLYALYKCYLLFTSVLHYYVVYM